MQRLKIRRESRGWTTWVFGMLAAIALLWPGHLAGPLDGVPLDHAAEAVLIGIVFPALCWFDRSFLERRSARILIVSLLTWKAFTSLMLVQDGWCVSLIPSHPYVRDQTGLPHSWDVRADWRSPNPACSAVMTRSYGTTDEFPVWFFNLPAANGDAPHSGDVPPAAVTHMTITGTLTARSAGILQIATTPTVMATARVDGQSAPVDGVNEIPPGSHQISIETTLVKNGWGLQVLWNGEDLFAHVSATESSPSALDRFVRPWGRWVSAVLAGTLLIAWILTALAAVVDAWTLAWMLAASVAIGLITAFTAEQRWQWALLALGFSGLLPLAKRVKNARGAFLLVGVPWLVLVVVATWYNIGRITFWGAGNDHWLFQRYAYRIFLQGYWLEGGEKTFWFQPLYRWIAGALHLVFGDSSIGETYWNGACLTVMALFSFVVTRVFAGVRWGLAAAAVTLALLVAGPGFIFVRGGLSEISSAGFIYLGALGAWRSRQRGSLVMAIGAGVCAVLGVYTRLNNLPMALAIAVFAWPIVRPISMLRTPSAWFTRVRLSTIAIVIAAIGIGLLLFAWRTYHYTGVFSVSLGTALDPGRGNARMLWANAASMRERMASVYGSVMMVLTTTDPPRIHNGAVPLVAAAMLSVVAVTGVGPLGALPFTAVLFMLSSLAGSLVSRGTAYPGRFSIHIVGASATVVVCAAAEITRRLRARFTRATT
jgi:hypothetical protein